MHANWKHTAGGLFDHQPVWAGHCQKKLLRALHFCSDNTEQDAKVQCLEICNGLSRLIWLHVGMLEAQHLSMMEQFMHCSSSQGDLRGLHAPNKGSIVEHDYLVSGQSTSFDLEI